MIHQRHSRRTHQLPADKKISDVHFVNVKLRMELKDYFMRKIDISAKPLLKYYCEFFQWYSSTGKVNITLYMLVQKYYIMWFLIYM